MSLFRRNEIWYASYSLPGGKRIKESLGTKDKRQAQELHDKRKAELWRVEKLGDLPDVTFEEACLRWLEEKADKKSLDSDKSRIEFWLEHFEGIRLKDISEAKIYSAVSRMHNRKTKEIWKQKVQAAIRKGKELPVYEPKPVSTQTKAKHLGDKGHSPCCRTRLEVAGKSACHQDTSGQKQASQMAGKGGSKTPY